MKVDEAKFLKAIDNIKEYLQNMDEADGYALADVLDNLTGIICLEILSDDFSAEVTAKKYNFETLNCQIDILRDKKIEEARRTLTARTYACLAFPIAKPNPEMRPARPHKPFTRHKVITFPKSIKKILKPKKTSPKPEKTPKEASS